MLETISTSVIGDFSPTDQPGRSIDGMVPAPWFLVALENDDEQGSRPVERVQSKPDLF
jgi:hypothetical protein